MNGARPSRPSPPVLVRAAEFLAGLKGARRWLAAALLGAAGALALPPLFVLPALVVSFTGLVWLLDGESRGHGLRQAFATGWWFGFGHFCAGLYWISHSLLVDAASHGWMVPFAVAGLSVYFAVYPALAAVAARLAPAGAARVLVLAVAFAMAEALRGVVFTGFPWNLMATTLAFDAALIQGVSLVGAYGLSLVVVALAAMPATLSVPRPAGWGDGRRRWLAAALAAAAFAVLWGGGALRLSLAPDPAENRTATVLRVIQPNIAQRDKWRTDLAAAHYAIYRRLSAQITSAGAEEGAAPALVIWPETALPYVMDANPRSVAPLAALAPPGGHLLAGMIRAPFPWETVPPGDRQDSAGLRNSVVAVTASGGIAAHYDKHHLVPFGEYVPLRRYNPLPRLVQGRLDFVPGAGPATLSLPGIPPFSPLVCYEVIFPGRAAPDDHRPAWLLNLTNDAWFGMSTGPYQHFAAARLRAVEEGLPLVRAANTGISAVIDPWGRVPVRLALGAQGAFDAHLPAALAGPTPFAAAPFAGFAILAGLILLLAAAVARFGPARRGGMSGPADRIRAGRHGRQWGERP